MQFIIVLPTLPGQPVVYFASWTIYEYDEWIEKLKGEHEPNTVR